MGDRRNAGPMTHCHVGGWGTGSKMQAPPNPPCVGIEWVIKGMNMEKGGDGGGHKRGGEMVAEITYLYGITNLENVTPVLDVL